MACPQGHEIRIPNSAGQSTKLWGTVGGARIMDVHTATPLEGPDLFQPPIYAMNPIYAAGSGANMPWNGKHISVGEKLGRVLLEQQ